MKTFLPSNAGHAVVDSGFNFILPDSLVKLSQYLFLHSSYFKSRSKAMNTS